MKTADLFRKKKPVLSFEVFPPKRTMPVESIYTTIDGLRGLKPDFISVTYGAGGGANSETTVEIAASIKRDYGIESVAHLPCVHLSREDVLRLLERFRQEGIENILALRGDRNPDLEPSKDFTYASDLVAFIRENGDFNITAACYPEGHGESGGIVPDMRNLKRKVDAGAHHLITQLFFDNAHFYAFRERAGLLNIDVPIEAGIMPVTNKRQIERMVTLCGVELPGKFSKMMARYEDNPAAMRDAGIAYAVDQIVDLIAQDVDGIHLYTMNNPLIAQRICAAIASLI